MSDWKLLEVVFEAAGSDCLVICERVSNGLLGRFSKSNDIHFFYGNSASGFIDARTLEKMPDEAYKLYVDWKVTRLLPRKFKHAWTEESE